MKEAVLFLKEEGFAKYDEIYVSNGLQILFRCKNVDSLKQPMCRQRYNIFLPAESNDIHLQHNCQEHTHVAVEKIKETDESKKRPVRLSINTLFQNSKNV